MTTCRKYSAAAPLPAAAGKTDILVLALLAFVEASGDPDQWVPQWVAGYTPAGIETEIPTCGVFPRVDPSDHATVEDDAFHAIHSVERPNYASYSENKEAVEQSRLDEIGRWRGLGSARSSGSPAPRPVTCSTVGGY